jgi:hypothetical protein
VNPFAAAIARMQPYYQQALTNDPQYLSTIQSLVGGLQQGWTSGVTTPAQQALISSGLAFNPNDPQVQAVLGKMGIPNLPWDPNTNLQQANGGGGALLQSLAAALSDPGTAAAAASNPISTEAQIAHDDAQSRINLRYQLAGQGLTRSGATPEGQATIADTAAAQHAKNVSDLLNTIGGNYQTYMGTLGAANQSRIQAGQDLFSRYANLIQNNALGAPTKAAPVPKAPPMPYTTPQLRAQQTRAVSQANAGYLSPNPIVHIAMPTHGNFGSLTPGMSPQQMAGVSTYNRIGPN